MAESEREATVELPPPAQTEAVTEKQNSAIVPGISFKILSLYLL